MKFNYNDGGRSKYFRATKVGDCVTRAIAIATQRDYKEVYDLVNQCEKNSRSKWKGSARNGAYKHNFKQIIEQFGGKWVSCMSIGTGCTTHLDSNELPGGRIICSCSKHLVAVIDGVVNDTYDSTRFGTRCVYGYWKFE